jgi:hypothetical protein
VEANNSHAVNTAWAMLALIYAGQVYIHFFVHWNSQKYIIYETVMTSAHVVLWACYTGGARSNPTISCCKRIDQHATRDWRLSSASKFSIFLACRRINLYHKFCGLILLKLNIYVTKYSYCYFRCGQSETASNLIKCVEKSIDF